jgi:integrase
MADKEGGCAMEKINFTIKSISDIPTPPTGRRAYYYDLKVSGLCVCVTDKGNKTFYSYKKINGRPERIMIGKFPDLSIEQARGQAGEINSRIANGENPNDLSRAKRAELIFADLFQKYMQQHSMLHKKSWKEDQGQYDRYLKKFAHKKISHIDKSDIQRLHHETGENKGHYAANRLLALLQSVFNKAIEWGLWEGANPCYGIKRFKEKSRDRFLQPDELPRFFEALANEPNDTIRDYFFLSLLTGARRANVLAMRWDQLNFERKEWRIPVTKNGDPQTIPLVKGAHEILLARQGNGSEWVFPSKGKTGHLVEPKTGWQRVCNRAGIKEVRIHDLRRSLGSWQASTGANLSIIGKTLNHKNVSTTAIYARLNIDPVREAMEKATSAMMSAGRVKEKAEIVEIKDARHA